MPKLIEIAQEYAYLKGIEVKPVMIAIRQLIDICGDKNIEDYDRADARNFILKQCLHFQKFLAAESLIPHQARH